MYMHNPAECDDPKRVLHGIDPPDPQYQKEGIDQGDAEGGAAASCELSALKSQEHTNKHPRAVAIVSGKAAVVHPARHTDVPIIQKFQNEERGGGGRDKDWTAPRHERSSRRKSAPMPHDPFGSNVKSDIWERSFIRLHFCPNHLLGAERK
ncbi:hypothetical protein EYF80_017469 [Liparis tanakae]|uniref:Uncharacterized protein n=1 Tax=Liparis tanakae TaxID=230148 RepID=A0A4Z2I2W0_9TELE|nr:hypothetical protein EYF80_017469 [Liparis tanakae]